MAINFIYSQTTDDEDEVNVQARGNWITFEEKHLKEGKAFNCRFTRDEAIAAARAILAHFGEVE